MCIIRFILDLAITIRDVGKIVWGSIAFVEANSAIVFAQFGERDPSVLLAVRVFNE